MKRIHQAIAVTMTMVFGMLLPNMQSAVASPPGNDALRRATEIGHVPFVRRQDTSEATASGPRFCGNSSSVFFAFTPTQDVTLQADTFGSGYDTVLTVFTGTRGNFSVVDCSDDAVGLASAVRFDAQAGTTYYFEISSCCGSGADNTGGDLVFALTQASTESLEVTVDFDEAILHPGRVVQLTGTVTCNQRLMMALDGILRQLNGDLVARSFFDSRLITCNPGKTPHWSAYVDTETGAAFNEGSASVRYEFFGSNGFDDTFESGLRARVRIVRAA